MQIIIKIENNIIEITLQSGRKVLDTVKFEEKRNLLEKLLPTIAKTLDKHGIKPQAVKKVRVVSDLSDSSTTRRIAETLAKTWNWANKK
jgi:hypothetical protein